MIDRLNISTLSEAVQNVVNSTYSDFYTRKYGNDLCKKIIDSDVDFPKTFSSLPLLSKDELLTTNYKERLFCNFDEIKSLYSTSGTTKNKKLCIIPRSQKSPDFILQINEKLEELGVRAESAVLILLPIANGHLKEYIYTNHFNFPIIVGDVNNLIAAKFVIADADIVGIVTLPSVFDRLAEMDISFKKIKWVLMSSENCTASRQRLFSNKFPHIYFDFSYGLAEAIGPIAYRCLAQEKLDPNIFHIIPSVKAEILDDAGNTVAEEEVGELVITTLDKRAFPLMRYKTGDAARLKNSNCSCDNNVTIEILGRIDTDFIRVSGVTFHEHIIDRVLSEYFPDQKFDFMFEVSEVFIDNQLKYKPIINLAVSTKTKVSKNDLAIFLSENLKVSSSKVLNDMIDLEIFLPIEVSLTEKIVDDSPKKLRVRRVSL